MFNVMPAQAGISSEARNGGNGVLTTLAPQKTAAAYTRRKGKGAAARS
jgi:hypothetical protein